MYKLNTLLILLLVIAGGREAFAQDLQVSFSIHSWQWNGNFSDNKGNDHTWLIDRVELRSDGQHVNSKMPFHCHHVRNTKKKGSFYHPYFGASDYQRQLFSPITSLSFPVGEDIDVCGLELIVFFVAWENDQGDDCTHDKGDDHRATFSVNLPLGNVEPARLTTEPYEIRIGDQVFGAGTYERPSTYVTGRGSDGTEGYGATLRAWYTFNNAIEAIELTSEKQVNDAGETIYEPASGDVCSGADLRLAAKNRSRVIGGRYEWQYAPKGTGNWSGYGGTDRAITVTSELIENNRFRVRLRGGNGCVGTGTEPQEWTELSDRLNLTVHDRVESADFRVEATPGCGTGSGRIEVTLTNQQEDIRLVGTNLPPIRLSPTNGEATYTYTGLADGTYNLNVTVPYFNAPTDVNVNCTTTRGGLSLTNFPRLSEPTVTAVSPTCGETTGRLEVSINSEGAGRAKLELLRAGAVVATKDELALRNGLQDDILFADLPPADYVLRMRSLGNNCYPARNTAVYTISEPPPTGTVTTPRRKTGRFYDILCPEDGSAAVEFATAGEGPLNLAIRDANGSVIHRKPGLNAGETYTFSLPPGSYQADWREGDGCVQTVPFSVVLKSITLDLTWSQFSYPPVYPYCRPEDLEGTLIATTSQPLAELTLNGESLSFRQTAARAYAVRGVPTGNNHILTVANTDGCVAEISIDGPRKIVPAPVAVGLPPDCADGTEGLIYLDGNYAQLGLTDFRVGGPGIDRTGPITNGRPVFRDLPSGAYTVTLSESGGCELPVDVDVPEVAVPVIERYSITQPACVGGEATITLDVRAERAYCTNGGGQFTILINGVEAGFRPTPVSRAGDCSRDLSLTFSVEPGDLDIAFRTSELGRPLVPGFFAEPQGGCLSNTLSIGSEAFTQPAPASISLGVITPARCVSNNFNTDVDASVPVNYANLPNAGTLSLVDAATGASVGREGAVRVNPGSGGSLTFTTGFTGDVLVRYDNYDCGYDRYFPGNAATVAGAGPGKTIVAPEPLSLVSAEVLEPAYCDGSRDPVARFVAAGGQPPYAFDAGGGFVASNTVELINRNFVVIRDANGCRSSIMHGLGRPTAQSTLGVATAVTDATACADEGEAVITLTGGTGPYDLRVFAGADAGANLLTVSGATKTEFRLTDLAAGDYRIEASDSRQCVATGELTFTVGRPAPLAAAVSDVVNLACGSMSGGFTLNVSGGRPPYDVRVNRVPYTTAGRLVLEDLGQGAYTILVRDADGCRLAEFFQTLTTTDGVTVTEEVTAAGLCAPDQFSGSVTLTPVGGTAPYQLTYDYSGSTQMYTLQAGESYSVESLSRGPLSYTVVDAGNCENEYTVDIPGPDDISVSLEIIQPVTCSDSGDAIFELDIEGGTPPYSANVDGVDYGEQTRFENVNFSPAIIQITDANGCQMDSPAIFDIPRAAPLRLVGGLTTQLGCVDDGGQEVSLNASGGNGGYRYGIVGQDELFDERRFYLQESGDYSFIVYDAKGCSATLGPLTAEVHPAIEVDVVISDPSCAGGTGSVTIVPQDPSRNYSATIQETAARSVDGTIRGVEAGNYTLIVTDVDQSDGCRLSLPIRLAESTDMIRVTTEVKPACAFLSASGAVTILAEGGDGNYRYGLTNNGFQDENVFTGLVPGSYDVTVVDGNDCRTVLPDVAVTVPNNPLSISSATVEDAICGEDNGLIEIRTSGGTGQILYGIREDGGVTPPATLQTSNVFRDLPGGNYTVYATDDLGCLQIRYNQSVRALEPLVIEFFTATPDDCDNTNVMFLAGEGGLGFSAHRYSLDGGPPTRTSYYNDIGPGNHTIELTDGTGCSDVREFSFEEVEVFSITGQRVRPDFCEQSNGSVTFELAGFTDQADILVYLGGGGGGEGEEGEFEGEFEGELDGSGLNYTVDGSTVRGLAAGQYFVEISEGDCVVYGEFTIPAGTGPTLTAAVENSCGIASGTVVLTAGGGRPPYAYARGTDGTFDGANTFFNVAAGNYTFRVRDANGCVISVDNVSVTGIEGLTIAPATTPVDCDGSGGDLTVNASGGGGDYTYQLDGGSPTSNDDYTGLTAGDHTLTVRSAAGCVLTEVPFTVGEVPAITGSVSQVDNTCTGGTEGSLLVTAFGGRGPLSYSLNGATSVDAGSFTGLAAGVYDVAVTDGGNCFATFDDITITEPGSAIVVTDRSSVPAACGGANGSATIEATGGTGRLTYTWGGGATTKVLTGLASGKYRVVISDEAGCSTVASVEVGEVSAPTATATTQVGDCGNENGSITVNATGGTGPYTYALGRGAFRDRNEFTGLASASYQVRVRDARGCETIISDLAVPESVPLLVEFSVGPIACRGETTEVTAEPVNGVGPFTYSLTGFGQRNGATATYTGLGAGGYTLTVSDNQGCSEALSFTVIEPAAEFLPVATPRNVSCAGANDGSIDVDVGGFSGDVDAVFNGQEAELADLDLTNLAPDNYTLELTNENGCRVVLDDLVVAEPTAIAVDDIITEPEACGQADGMATVTATGGTGQLRYAWPDGTGSNTITGLAAGNYAVTISDGSGCQLEIPVEIPSAGGPTATAEATAATCGDDNGAVNLTATGGAGNYTYSIDGTDFTDEPRFEDLAAGQYDLTVRDGAGCDFVVSNVTVPAAAPLTATATVSEIRCTGDRAQISVAATGGTPPYAYQLNDGDRQEERVFDNLDPGNYTVTVYDANNCRFSPTAVAITAPTPITATITSSAVSCFGEADGSINVAAAGGTGTTYDIRLVGNPFDQGGTITGLTAGTYTVRVTDENGCVATFPNISVTQPAELRVESATVRPADEGQRNAQIAVTATGGTGGYRYALDDGNFGPDNVFSGLPPGVYSVRVRDDNGCVATRDNITVTESLVFSATASATPIRCAGDRAVLTVVTTNGTPDFVYQLNGGPAQASNVFPNLEPGDYTVTVTDEDDQRAVTATVTIAAPPAITANITTTPVSCFGAADGGISVLPAGGAGGDYRIRLVGALADSDGDIGGLAPGFYAVSVTDGNDCTVRFESIEITGPAALSVRQRRLTPESCRGADGGIDLEITGGTGALRFAWSSGEETEDLSGKVAGSYTVTVTDANDCKLTETFTVEAGTAPTAVAVVSDATCRASNGAVTIRASGGAGGYTYAVGDGTFTPNSVFANLAAGTYDFRVRDANDCTYLLIDVEIGDTPPPTVRLRVTDIACRGGTATLTATASGGTAGYTYALNDGAAGPGNTFGDLPAGTYTVTVYDAAGCATQSDPVTVVDPSGVTATVAVTPAVCSGEPSGGITVSPTGGSGSGYTVRLVGRPGEAGPTFSDLSAGLYAVEVTDGRGCSTLIENIEVTEPTTINVVTREITPERCGQSDGSISLTATGGTGDLRYAWPDGSAAATLTGLAAGLYTVTISDASDCVLELPLAVGSTDGPTATPFIVNASCGEPTGSVTITAAEGAGGYTYSVDGGPFQPANTFSNLRAGDYEFAVRDANDCLIVLSGVTVGGTPAFEAGAKAELIPCAGGTGSIAVTPIGGTAGYLYRLNGGAVQSSFRFEGLTAGRYTVTVTDANGCEAVTTPIDLTDPAPLTATSTATDPTCRGGGDGSISLIPSDDVTPYRIELVGSSEAVPGTTLSGLSAGDYDLQLTNGNGCVTVLEGIVLTEPAEFTVGSITTTPENCGQGNGTATVTTNGGGGALRYAWSNGDDGNTTAGLTAGRYEVTVTNADGCTRALLFTVGSAGGPTAAATVVSASCGRANGSVTLNATGGQAPYTFARTGRVFSPAATFTDLSPGDYDFTVRDAVGCIFQLNKVTVTDSPPLTVAVSATEIDCQGSTGAIAAAASGGSPGYRYRLSGRTSDQAGSTFAGLAPGSYTVSVIDDEGCEAESGTIELREPAPVTASVNLRHATCSDAADGSITVVGGGGSGAGYSVGLVGEPSVAGNVIGGLAAGVYDIRVTDGRNCALVVRNLTITEPDALEVTGLTVTPENCGQGNGSATLAVAGGTGSLTYAWSNGARGAAVAELAAGNYEVVVTDGNGCTLNVPLTVGALDGPTLAAEATDATCGLANGTVTLTAGGGTPPYRYALTGEAFGAGREFAGLAAGNYSFTVRDGNGCTSTLNGVGVGAAEPLVVTVSASDIPCNDGTGTIAATATGGTGPYNYALNGGATAESGVFAGLGRGNYTVVVTDGNGCRTTADPITITPPPALTATATVSGTSCVGATDGAITVVPTGGSGGYTVRLAGDASGAGSVIGELAAGTYTVVVTDVNGCTFTLEGIAVADPESIVIAALTTRPEDCGQRNGGASVTATGGTDPLTYAWSTGVAGREIGNLGAGEYALTVTDANGCSSVVPVRIGSTDGPTASFAVIDARCGAANGEITVTPSGGTGPFTYSIAAAVYGPENTFTGLATGTYSITVRDANGCNFVLPELEVADRAAPTIDVLATDAACNGAGGSVTATVTGGQAPFAYRLNGGPAGPDSLFTALRPGVYRIAVTDANGCTSTSDAVTLTQPAVLTATTVVTAPSCAAGNDGVITVSPVGGVGPYTVGLAGEPPVGGRQLSGLTAGDYSVRVLDANGCELLLPVAVSPLERPSVELTVGDPACHDGRGSIVAVGRGGSGGYSYALDGGTPRDAGTFADLPPGDYTVRVTDAAGCTSSGTATISAPAPLVASVSTQTDPGCDNDDGAISVTATGGTGTLSFAWADELPGGPELTGLTGGTYALTVTDDNGCRDTLSVVLDTARTGGPAVAGLPADTTICQGELFVLDLSTYDRYAVSGPGNFSSIDPVSLLEVAGTYTIETGSGTCTDRQDFTLNYSAAPLTAAMLVPSDVVRGDSVLVLEISWPIPETVEWSFDPATTELLGQDQNQYFFRFSELGTQRLGLIASGDGCEDVAVSDITVHADSSTIATPTLGVAEILDLVVLPNPSDGQFRLEVRLSAAQPLFLNLFDLNGTLVDRKQAESAAEHALQYNLSLTPGTYILQVQTPTQGRTLTILIN